MLKYQTSGDERVRDEHVAWDGIIKPVDDPFWNTVSAPNGYNCRCEIIQLSSGKPTNLDTHLKKVNTQFKKEGKKPLKNLNNTAPLFSDNVGKTGQVFNKNEHPYFDAPKSKLDTNFGLPVTQTLLKKVVKPKKVTKKQTSATSIKEAEKNQKQWIDNTLTSNEAKAIEDWTSGDYRFINAELRYGDKLEIHGLPDKRISEIKKNTALMEGILKESPKYEGKVYRGTKFQYENQRDEFLQGLGKGDIFTDKGYMSTSYDKSVVSEFQRPGTFNVTFDINSKKGTMIDQLSRRGDEKEILLNKNSSFIIDSVLKENNGNVVVKMTEM